MAWWLLVRDSHCWIAFKILGVDFGESRRIRSFVHSDYAHVWRMEYVISLEVSNTKSLEKTRTYSSHLPFLINGHSLPCLKFYFFLVSISLASNCPYARNWYYFQFFCISYQCMHTLRKTLLDHLVGSMMLHSRIFLWIQNQYFLDRNKSHAL
jgi:hypothetical protein